MVVNQELTPYTIARVCGQPIDYRINFYGVGGGHAPHAQRNRYDYLFKLTTFKALTFSTKSSALIRAYLFNWDQSL